MVIHDLLYLIINKYNLKFHIIPLSKYIKYFLICQTMFKEFNESYEFSNMSGF